MSDQPPMAGAEQAPQVTFQIEKLYVKDLSLEVPNAPGIYMQAEGPQLEISVQNAAEQFGDGLFEVTVTVTVTARAGERVVFLAEAAQAGIFQVRGVPAEDLDPLLGIAAPTILYPYVREVISDVVTRAGFPPVVLTPVSFERIYMERRQQLASQSRIETAQ